MEHKVQVGAPDSIVLTTGQRICSARGMSDVKVNAAEIEAALLLRKPDR